MPVKHTEREYRNATEAFVPVEQEQETTYMVEGYATTFNNAYVLYDDDSLTITESVSDAAFNECDLSDVILQYDHSGPVFARVSNGTLDVQQDEHGLKVTADLGGTDAGRHLYEEIRGGYIKQMSIGMHVAQDSWKSSHEGEKRVEHRTIDRIDKLFDVSAVSIPANGATEISVRALTAGVAEKVTAECRQHIKDNINGVILNLKLKNLNIKKEC